MSGQRIDKWLWFARFYKSRSLAASMVEAGEVWRNDHPVGKAAQPVQAGDVLRFPQGNSLLTVQVVQPGTRRGPAPEAAGLYRLLSRTRPQDAEDQDQAGVSVHMRQDSLYQRP